MAQQPVKNHKSKDTKTVDVNGVLFLQYLFSSPQMQLNVMKKNESLSCLTLNNGSLNNDLVLSSVFTHKLNYILGKLEFQRIVRC